MPLENFLVTKFETPCDILLRFNCYSSAEYISLRSKRFRAVLEQRKRNDSQRRRAKNGASKRAGRGKGVGKKPQTENPVPRSFFAPKLNGNA